MRFSVCVGFFSTLILNACIHVPNWGIYFCGGGVHCLLKTLNGVFVWTDEWSEQRGYAEVRPKKHSRSTMWVPDLEAAGWDLRPLLAWSSLAHCLSFIATTHKCNHCKLWKKKKINQNEIKEQLYFHEIKTSDFLGIFLNLFVKYFGFHIILRVWIMLFKILINLTKDQFIFEIAIFKSNYKRLHIFLKIVIKDCVSIISLICFFFF